MGRNTDFIYSSRSFAKSLLGQEFFQGQEIEWGTCHLVFITCSIFFCNDLFYPHELHPE